LGRNFLETFPEILTKFSVSQHKVQYWSLADKDISLTTILLFFISLQFLCCHRQSALTDRHAIIVAAPKYRQYFRESFAIVSALKFESFRYFATIIRISAKKCNFKICTNVKMPESKVFVVSQLIFLGGQKNSSGRRPNIAESFTKTRQNFASSKCHQNSNTT